MSIKLSELKTEISLLRKLTLIPLWNVWLLARWFLNNLFCVITLTPDTSTSLPRLKVSLVFWIWKQVGNCLFASSHRRCFHMRRQGTWSYLFALSQILRGNHSRLSCELKFTMNRDMIWFVVRLVVEIYIFMILHRVKLEKTALIGCLVEIPSHTRRYDINLRVLFRFRCSRLFPVIRINIFMTIRQGCWKGPSTLIHAHFVST